MADPMTPQQRHNCMAAIRSKNTKPEMIVRRYIHALGLRYGLHNRRLPGTPDIVLRRLKTVIFVHGCFWHGHRECRNFKMPTTRNDFWSTKIKRNRSRDESAVQKLTEMGWNVIVVWECELRTQSQRLQTLYSLGRRLLDLRDGVPPQYIPYDDSPAAAAEPDAPYS